MDCTRCGANASATRAKNRSNDRCEDRSEDYSFERANGGGGRFDFRCVVSIPIAGYRLKSSSVTTVTIHLGLHSLVLRPSPLDGL